VTQCRHIGAPSRKTAPGVWRLLSWRGKDSAGKVSQHCSRCAPVPNLLATDAAGRAWIGCPCASRLAFSGQIPACSCQCGNQRKAPRLAETRGRAARLEHRGGNLTLPKEQMPQICGGRARSEQKRLRAGARGTGRRAPSLGRRRAPQPNTCRGFFRYGRKLFAEDRRARPGHPEASSASSETKILFLRAKRGGGPKTALLFLALSRCRRFSAQVGHK
jgi:hypothetical protein